MSKKYTHNILGETTPDFIPTNDFYAFDTPQKKKSKKEKKAKKRDKKLAKKLKKARKQIKYQEKLLHGDSASTSMTWWQQAVLESLPKLIDLVDSRNNPKK